MPRLFNIAHSQILKSYRWGRCSGGPAFPGSSVLEAADKHLGLLCEKNADYCIEIAPLVSLQGRTVNL